MNLVPAGAVAGAGEADGRLAGFRPEYVELANGHRDWPHFGARVGVVEYLSDEQLVHMRFGENDLLAKLPIEQRLAPGDERTFVVPPDKLHLFDGETEQAIR